MCSGWTCIQHSFCLLQLKLFAMMQVTLNNGRTMPSIGFGTAGLGQQTLQAVHQALLAGYTLFDTAQASTEVSYMHDQCPAHCLLRFIR